MGSAVQRHVAAPWRAWQSITPTLMATTQSPDTDSLFSSTPRLRGQLSQLPDHPFTTNEQTHFRTQTTWSSPPPEKPLKRNKSQPFKETSTSNSTTASPTHLLNKPSSYHNLLHTLVHPLWGLFFSVSLFLCFSFSLFLCFSVSLFLCFSVSLFLFFSFSLFLFFSFSLFLCLCLILLSQSTSHTSAHLMQPSSEAYEAEDRCFRVSVARRLMLPRTRQPPTLQMCYSLAPTKVQRA